MPEFRMPSLGADMTEGTLLHWMVHPGDPVHAGDVIAEVDTTKAAIEIECFDDGVIGTILVPEGETVPVGAVLATIEPATGSTPPPPDAAGAVNPSASAVNPSASTEELEPRRSATAAADTGLQFLADRQRVAETGAAPEATRGTVVEPGAAPGAVAESGAALRGDAETEFSSAVLETAFFPSAVADSELPSRVVAEVSSPSSGSESRARGAVTSAPGPRPPTDDTGNSMVLREIRVTPLVRRLAAEAGIDLATVVGSGPDGRIVRADIERVAAERTGTSPATGLGNAVDRAGDAGASAHAETGQSYPTRSASDTGSRRDLGRPNTGDRRPDDLVPPKKLAAQSMKATSRPKHVAGRDESDLIRRDAGPAAPSEPGVDVVAAERCSGQAETAETGRAVDRLHVRASGYARRVARELAVDLAEVTGTGPGGALRAADIRAAHRESIHRRQVEAVERRRRDSGSAGVPVPDALAGGDLRGGMSRPNGSADHAGSAAPGTGVAGVSDAAVAAGPGDATVTARPGDAAELVGTPGDAAEFAGIPGGSVGITSTSDSAGVGVPGVGVGDAAAGPGAAGHTRDVGAVRAMIAAAMTRSKQTVPHYYLSSTIDMAAAVGWLRETNRRLAVSERVLPAALLLRATALAARKVPDVNGFWVDGRFEPAERVDLGVVVSLRGGGIIVPTVPRADTLSVPATMAAVRGIVARSRDGQLRAADATPATLTVTNLGDLGVDSVFGVIPPPQVAIVGFGAVTERPCAVDGLLGVRPQVTATLSADHRASDGAVGARFLHTLSELLQHPEEL
ncbi:Dihydrolipoyllysine-residue acetyltransferase component of pyruvate dehydrogenase complex [Nocardia otitidiscaviarum]|uniref:Dihydrolipoamide acetyltransferase component of pyruvate dehydrogenase complex n=1 Tax=Nocardia otitidiscaviarum TaxID=1823 RepID=A0A379JMZ5_9NOCA|nr:2-oxo acid dehydrogenase subunit E2 [Nocardia otitidiscaviarum]SUD49383.1 Dihydrolipoyllysine-residue acetyltransferase component of pyruvate dehydrogenase complex [Nocardia otitidiscaviarum]